jgi:oligopeptide transport system ATP-binding protein
MTESQPLIVVEKLKKYFPVSSGMVFQRKTGSVRAVDGISFSIAKGETLGLVGESGCGKTTAGRTILNLYTPTEGRIVIDGEEWTGANKEKLKLFRRKTAMIFQDPYASLNPRWTVSAIVSEPLRVHKLFNNEKERTQFSGGQRQRIGVARALASDPLFIVCDEPISALDVSIQAQVVNLLEELQDKFGLTYLFIAHDLSMVRHICDRVAVMYLGVIVELGERNEVYEKPIHPYTKALLSAVPIPDPKRDRERRRIILSGDVPSPINPPSGCRFHPRCPVGMEHCKIDIPEWHEASPGHWVACHSYG